jgi:hypothetical protein
MYGASVMKIVRLMTPLGMAAALMACAPRHSGRYPDSIGPHSFSSADEYPRVIPVWGPVAAERAKSAEGNFAAWKHFVFAQPNFGR